MKKIHLVLCSSFVLASATVFAKTENKQSASSIQSAKTMSYLQNLAQLEKEFNATINIAEYDINEQNQISAAWGNWGTLCQKGTILGASIPQIVTNLENSQKQRKVDLSGTIKNLKNGYYRSNACLLSLLELTSSDSKTGTAYFQRISDATPNYDRVIKIANEWLREAKAYQNYPITGDARKGISALIREHEQDMTKLIQAAEKEIANNRAKAQHTQAEFEACKSCYRIVKEQPTDKEGYIAETTIECTSGISKGERYYPSLHKDGVYINPASIGKTKYKTLSEYAEAHCRN